MSKARISILKLLLLDSGRQSYLRELAHKTGLTVRSVQVEVKRLTTAGILERETSGRQTYYRVNERCPIVPELRSIFAKTAGVADAIRKALLPESDSISTAFIYGSFARGDIRAESDIDLFVVGTIELRRLTAVLKNVDVARVINPTVMSVAEFKSRLTEGDHFVSPLVNSPKQFLIGDEGELRGLG
ncbi:MAG: hypothetical protein A2Z18_06185 [Armatimonadetes bacterium RBG_16_58_9]|nr:MAG: hypothetical protein A2Z18_06185 [Armatimonadetes bacterium RBG_16_58_9]